MLLGAAGFLAADPAAFLAPGQRASTGEAGFPRFQDITNKAGIDFRLDSGDKARIFLLEQPSAGVLVIDYDHDGWIDIYLVNGSTPDRADGGHKSRGNRLCRVRRFHRLKVCSSPVRVKMRLGSKSYVNRRLGRRKVTSRLPGFTS